MKDASFHSGSPMRQSSAAATNSTRQKIISIFTWERPIVSACLLTSINLFYLLLFVMDKTVLSVVSGAYLALMALGAICKLFDLVGEDGSNVEVVSRGSLESCLSLTYDVVNDGLCGLRSLIFWRDGAASLQAVFFLSVAWFVGRYVSFPFLFWLLAWSAFLFSYAAQAFAQHLHPIIAPNLRAAAEAGRKAFLAIPRMEHVKKDL
eukprot:GHVT01069264.1.p1 GENE.GHVT01069264.1~~GHVT01069264.1.p1  ORF type:complete len:206 (+),score=30.61 GHVT01069264.1:173-790(+)